MIFASWFTRGHWRETFAALSALACYMVIAFLLILGAEHVIVRIGHWDWSFVPVVT